MKTTLRKQQIISKQYRQGDLMLSKCPNIPKIIERESELPAGMTSDQLGRVLYPNWLALTRIFAHHELKQRANQGNRKQDHALTP